ncbi:hypothetical protein M407DRAFT_3597 [Tulasnella calospora MUT 4182]|uniref:Uncharacterized protein n=1 Tax=Tulasnella calospora MUT 4182 TaxID=1051891 RepID=A0A0C3MK99_9AGAM|nr:hypothetical protein M407DRAFT_3597 [Tulasnella calospora MUT 4182]
MFVAALAQTAILHQYFYICFLTGMRIRAGLVTTIYKKALVLSNDAQGSRGDIVNLMSVDATRMQDLTTYGLIFISGPFQIILAFVSLYQLLGWPSFVGVAIMIVAIPAQGAAAQWLKRLQVKQMKIRDQRTKLMSELLSNIKSIKLYSWENAFIGMVTSVRNAELRTLRRIAIISALNTVAWGSIPLLVSLATFAVAAYAGPFAMIVSSIVQATVSVNRLADFLGSSELQPDAVKVEEVSLAPGDVVVQISNGDFRWAAKSVEPTLQDIDLTVRKGELVGILGRVGSGKTSLLSAITGEMTKVDGKVELHGSVAYCAQNPWILSSSLRDNITFFRKFDQTFYDLVLDACALRQDIALLKDGDQTEVGEKGITLSGGQRARVALARAVYARADLYLLDDVLAAVDAHVARHIFAPDNVIGPNGLLASKARIHVTNGVAYASQHDSLVFLRRGIILESGSYSEIRMKPETELYKLITGAKSLSADQSRSDSGTATPVNSEGVLIDEDEPTALKKTVNEQLKRRKSQRPPSFVSPETQKVLAGQSLGNAHKTMQKELSEQGEVKWEVYRQYMNAASAWGFAAYLLCILGQQVARVASTWVLKNWGENNLSQHPRPPGYFLAWYGGWVAGSAVISAASGILLWMTMALRSSKKLHERVRDRRSSRLGFLRAPLQFFETTPQGRILNLFSRDMYTVDEVLVRVWSAFFSCIATVGGIFIVIIMSFPSSVIVILPLAYLYQVIMRYYLATSREIKRLDAVSKLDFMIPILIFGLVRSAISIIPQEPQLFEGTIRQNVDPTESADDQQIWTALEHSHLKEYVLSLEGGLDAVVREGGTSLSAGQRQLLCFARALLRKSKILILDEATSAVDLQTDAAIQDIIRGSHFEGVTLLVIAHRLNTIMHSDRILVLDCGMVAEFDSPAKLMADPTTRFSSLAHEAGVLAPLSKEEQEQSA